MGLEKHENLHNDRNNAIKNRNKRGSGPGPKAGIVPSERNEPPAESDCGIVNELERQQTIYIGTYS